MPFVGGVIKVFSRTGAPLGYISHASITKPRSYRLSALEDMSFRVPLRDGATILVADADASLFARDNLVLLDNTVPGMPPWGGYIANVDWGADVVAVECAGTLGLLGELPSLSMEQDSGSAVSLARRLVDAANAYKAAHGDLVVGFAETATTQPPLRGLYEHSGDIMSGLTQLATDTLCEFYMTSGVGADGRFWTTLNWGGELSIDHTDVVIRDGVGGNLRPGTHVVFNGTERVNHAVLEGAPTTMAEHLDYRSVQDVLKELVPRVTVSLTEDEQSGARRRVAQDFRVNWGLPIADQKALARRVQAKYLVYYKKFLAAYHDRFGSPFLPGYEWSGPDSGKKMTELRMRNFRTAAVLGRVDVPTVATWEDLDAELDHMRYLSPTIDMRYRATPIVIEGVATYWPQIEQRLLGARDGRVYLVERFESGQAAYQPRLVLDAARTGETLRGIATDETDADGLWVLMVDAMGASVRRYSLDTLALLTEWRVADPNARDLAVDAARGEAYMVGGSGTVTVRDLSGGASLRTFASGFASCVGVSFSYDIVYLANVAAKIRMLHRDGTFAGEEETAHDDQGGLFVDTLARHVWVIGDAGWAMVYAAGIVVDVVGGSTGDSEGAPGFDDIDTRQHVRIVMTDNRQQGDVDDVPSEWHKAPDVPFLSQMGRVKSGVWTPWSWPGGWGLTNNQNCGGAAGAMALRRHTWRLSGGPINKTPVQFRVATGDRVVGLNLDDIAKGFEKATEGTAVGEQHLELHKGARWRLLTRALRDGKGVVLMVGNKELKPYACGTPSETGLHTIYLHAIRANGDIQVYNSGCSYASRGGVRWVPQRVLMRAAKKYAGTSTVRAWFGTTRSTGSLVRGEVDVRAGDERVFVVYTKGRWRNTTEAGDLPGDPARVVKEWANYDGEFNPYQQKAALLKSKDVSIADVDKVIMGEEGRVDDWVPASMGYGVQGTSHYVAYGLGGPVYMRSQGWYLHPWDRPASEFWVDDEPEAAWEAGDAHLRRLLVKFNREQGSQAFDVVNRANLWGSIERGGVYTFQLSNQGPQPTGLVGQVRIVAFVPDEMSGYMQCLAEWVS